MHSKGSRKKHKPVPVEGISGDLAKEKENGRKESVPNIEKCKLRIGRIGKSSRMSVAKRVFFTIKSGLRRSSE